MGLYWCSKSFFMLNYSIFWTPVRKK